METVVESIIQKEKGSIKREERVRLERESALEFEKISLVRKTTRYV